MERLFQGLSHDEYLMAMGRVQAIRHLATLPDTLDHSVRAQQEARTNHARRSDPDPFDPIFYGTPWFGAMEGRGERPSVGAG